MQTLQVLLQLQLLEESAGESRGRETVPDVRDTDFSIRYHICGGERSVWVEEGSSSKGVIEEVEMIPSIISSEYNEYIIILTRRRTR